MQPLTAKGQDLNKLFVLPGTVTTVIKTLLIDQDTIVAFGGVIDIPGHIGIHISKYDTLGHLLSYNTYFHPQEKPYYLAAAAGFIKTSDGGYLGVGDINLGDAIVVFKFSHTGDLEWSKEIEDLSLRVQYGFIPVECKGGYMIPGFIQYDNYEINGLIYKISTNGNILWRKDYGVAGPGDLIGIIIKKDDNTFFASGGQFTQFDVDDPNYWSRNWVFEMDSTGTLMSEWRSAIADRLTTCLIRLSGETELIYITVKNHPTPTDPSLPALIEFVMRKMDTNDWHIIWQTSQTGPDMTYLVSWQNLEQSPIDGAWDVVGTCQHFPNAFVMSGILAHVNPEDGSTIWLRKDTAYISPLLNINENYLRSIGHLSSGSIIAGGFVLSTEGGDLHQEAWLLKLSPGGCLEPDDCPTVAAHEPGTAKGPSFLNWEVFPNPATNYTMLMPNRDLQGREGKVALFDVQGKMSREFAFCVPAHEAIRVDLSGLPLGLYTYQVQVGGQDQGRGRIMVMW